MIVLTDLEEAAAKHWKEKRLYSTEVITSRIIVGRHKDEYSEVYGGVEKI